MHNFNKEYITGKGSAMTLTKNEIKNIIKVIKPLENRGSLLKDTTGKLLLKKKAFSIFLYPYCQLVFH